MFGCCMDFLMNLMRSSTMTFELVMLKLTDAGRLRLCLFQLLITKKTCVQANYALGIKGVTC